MLSAINPRLPQDLWNRKLNALSEILICLGYSIYYFECTLMVNRLHIFEYKLEDIEIAIEWKHFHPSITY